MDSTGDEEPYLAGFTGRIDDREDDGDDLEPDDEGETVMWDSDPHRSQEALA